MSISSLDSGALRAGTEGRLTETQLLALRELRHGAQTTRELSLATGRRITQATMSPLYKHSLVIVVFRAPRDPAYWALTDSGRAVSVSAERRSEPR